MGWTKRHNTLLIILILSAISAWLLMPAAASYTTAFIDKVQSWSVGQRHIATAQAVQSPGVFLRLDADTGCWQEWKDGVLGWQLCTNRVIPGDCASDRPTLEFGAFCKDQTSGRVIMNTGVGGLVYLTGTSL